MLRSPALRLRQGSLLALAIRLAFAAPAFAQPPSAALLPQGPSVVAGQANFRQPNPNTTLIQAANGTIINWQQFSIGAGQTTRFIESGSNSAVLNRVTGNQISSILGQLTSNGHVFLVNPNGIVIGVGARIDTDGFIASTLDMSDADFLAGKLNFIAASAAGSIHNEGLIAVGNGGQIALIAPNIENSGVLFAPGGEILLAAGRSVQIASMDLEGVSFSVQAPSDSVVNLGRLIAEGGTVELFASSLTQSGVISASGLAADAAGHVELVAANDLTVTRGSSISADGATGGSIVLDSRTGTSELAGLISAQGSKGAGGSIELLGTRVALNAGTEANASGASAGGQVLVGGDYQGRDSTVQNAQMVYVDPAAALIANSTANGNGGRVIVWSDVDTAYFGSLSTRGAGTGNGGFAEVSGHENLDFAGTADLDAAHGRAGTLLLDPLDIIISSNGGVLPSVVSQFTTFPNNIVTISPAGINRVGGNVVLEAGRNIDVETPVNFTGSSLTLDAGMASTSTTGSIYLYQGISTSGGSLNLSGYSVYGSGVLSTAGGHANVNVTGGLYNGLTINSGGGAVTIAAQAGAISGTHIDAGSGAVKLDAATGYLSGNTVTGGSVTLDSSGSQSDTVSASVAVNASSTSSSIVISAPASTALRVGSVTGASEVELLSAAGVVNAGGSGISAPAVYLFGENGTGTFGTSAVPLGIATTALELHNLGGSADVALKGSPTLSDLYLEGTTAALGATRVTGAANLSSLSLGAGSGVLDLNATASGGFSNGFTVHVTNGGIDSSTLSVPGAVALSAVGPVTLGTVNSSTLTVAASGAISASSITATGSYVDLTSGSCQATNTACTSTSGVAVTTLSAASGSVDLTSTDNGNISLGTVTAGSLTATAGYYDYSSSIPRTSQIQLGQATIGGTLSIINAGTGAISASGAISSTDTVTMLALHGTVGTQAITSSSGDIDINASGAIGFSTLAASGSASSISLTSAAGSITSSVDSATPEINATGNVSLSAPTLLVGSIGNAAFTHPLSIEAGSSSTVTLVAGADIGAQGKPVDVDTSGSISVTSSGGSFYVSAVDPSGVAQAVGTINLSAQAAGMGAGGTSSFTSRDLSIAATSDGSTITIGNIVQSADNLNQFGFAAAGPSNLNFGNVNLQTSGNNQLSLSAGGALTQTNPGSNSISAGNITLSGGTASTMTLGNVVSANAAGNVLTITGGDISAGTLTAGSMVVNGASLTATGLTTNGTLRGYYTGYAYDPILGYSTYITDEMHVTTTGSIATQAGITSATSVYLTAGTGISVNGGAAAISGGNSNPPYYTDMVSITAGSGPLLASSISAFDVSVTGTTIHTGAITALSGNLSVDGTTLNTGALSAPSGSVTVTGSTFATGNISAGNGTLTLTATGAYAQSGVALSSTANAVVNAGGAIDLSAGGASLTAPTVSLNGSGDIAATLHGTSSLATQGARTLVVSSDTALSTLDVTARGDLFGSSSAVTAPGQSFGFASSGTSASLAFTSPTAVNLSYTESGNATQVSTINVASNLTGSSQFTLAAGAAQVNANSIVSNGGAVNLASSGDIDLVSVNSGGGVVSADSSAGNIGIGAVVTGGASFSATSETGSITRLGSAPIQIDTQASGQPSGSVTLSAPAGSVGAGGTPLVISNATSLSIDAPNSIAVDLNGTTLTNLSLVTSGAGSGTLSIANNPNYAGFSLTRSGGDLVLGAVLPTQSGSFGLTATSGGIVVAGNISVYDLSLDARDNGANSTGTLTIDGSAGGRTVSASNGMSLASGGAMTIAAGNGAGTNVSISGGNSLSINAGALAINAAGGSASVTAAGTSFTVDGDFQVVGGSAGVANATASLTSTGSQYFTVYGNTLIEGGASSGASATVTGYYQSLFTSGNLSVLGGGGGAASATLSASYQNLQAVEGAVLVKGGSATGASAGIVTTSGYQYVGNQDTYYYTPTSSVTVQGGTASGTTASITSAGYQSIATDGSISVLGGSGSGSNASIANGGSSQNVGSTYGYYTPATKNILVEAGSAGTATISGVGNQVVEGDGTISVLGGGSHASASIVDSGGSQTVGSAQNTSYYYPTQYVIVRGGNGNNATAAITASGSQTIGAGVSVAVTGGAQGASASITSTGGPQSIGDNSGGQEATGMISVTGGSATGASAVISSGAAQDLYAQTSVDVSNPGSNLASINAQAAQTLYTANVSVTQGAGLTNATAEIRTAGTQSFVLNGNSTSVTIDNTGTGSGSIAQIYATGNQTISMPYSTAAGALSIGSTTDTGASLLYAGGTQNLLAGSITIQGGATSAAHATITAVGDSTMSGINGTVSVLGGSAGPAAIDPPNLDLITDGSVIVTAGPASSATATITAGNINIGASNGNVLVTGGSVSGAAASIAANGTPGTLNLYSSGNLVFTPNAGGATISAVAPSGNNIFLLGNCVGCTAGLVGAFNITAAAQLAAVQSSSTPTDSQALDLLVSLLDYLNDLDNLAVLNDDGTITLDGSGKLPQCN